LQVMPRTVQFIRGGSWRWPGHGRARRQCYITGLAADCPCTRPCGG
jgi:hypothetical protein